MDVSDSFDVSFQHDDLSGLQNACEGQGYQFAKQSPKIACHGKFYDVTDVTFCVGSSCLPQDVGVDQTMVREFKRRVKIEVAQSQLVDCVVSFSAFTRAAFSIAGAVLLAVSSSLLQ